jgi:hypothetical protein
MTLRMTGLLPALGFAVTLGLAAPSLAQNAPLTLPPPGASGGEKVAPSTAKKAPRKKKATDESGLAIPGAAKSGKAGEPSFSESAVARPKKFVPAEFDNEDTGGGGSARPIMTPSGRAGVGMRF